MSISFKKAPKCFEVAFFRTVLLSKLGSKLICLIALNFQRTPQYLKIIKFKFKILSIADKYMNLRLEESSIFFFTHQPSTAGKNIEKIC